MSLFEFSLGGLLQAVKNGDWVLLDEINLAPPEVLAAILPALEGRSFPSVPGREEIFTHEEFRVFACMNPPTDVGKRQLPPRIRRRFHEVYISQLIEPEDIQPIISTMLGPTSPVKALYGFFTKVKSLSRTKLKDGRGRSPVFTLRNLVRSINLANDLAIHQITPMRALFEGLCMAFSENLDKDSKDFVENLILTEVVRSTIPELFGTKLANSLTCGGEAIEPPVIRKNTIDYLGFSIPSGPSKCVFDNRYMLTPSRVIALRGICRAVVSGRHPVLLEGPTSAGKTSLVRYLAHVTGHKFVRINNHDGTDLEEYLGRYVPTADGNFKFVEGALVRGVKEGWWILLDELNLAPTDVLEALNRLLDDNRELFVPETQETIKPHRDFFIFATQNPAGVYGGRKALSRAFRNRFVELHLSDIPSNELEAILLKRNVVSPTLCKMLVRILISLRRERLGSHLFSGNDAVITLRDLFRLADTRPNNPKELAQNAYLLIAERLREPSDRNVVLQSLQRETKTQFSPEAIYDQIIEPLLQTLQSDQVSSSSHPLNSYKCLTFTPSFKRQVAILLFCVQCGLSPVLVGPTGCGKTTSAQLVSEYLGQELTIFNGNRNTDACDFLGGLRPIRRRGDNLFDEIFQQTITLAQQVLDYPQSPSHKILKKCCIEEKKKGEFFLNYSKKLVNYVLGEKKEVPFEGCVDIPSPHFTNELEIVANARDLKQKILTYRSLFEWMDGPLPLCMKKGGFFLFDEISLVDDSVLERMNSVLEDPHVLTIPERGEKILYAFEANLSFRFIATMNPGGDFGKRELSRAMRNRLTEVWTGPSGETSELISIFQGKVPDVVAGLYSENLYNVLEELKRSNVLISARDITQMASYLSLPDLPDPKLYACLELTLLDGLELRTGFETAICNSIRNRVQSILDINFSGMEDDLQAWRITPIMDDDTNEYMFCFQFPPNYVVHLAPGPLILERYRQSEDPFAVLFKHIQNCLKHFSIKPKSTRVILSRILRVLSIKEARSPLLEGPPGTGKTSCLVFLSELLGYRLVRLNMSEQTDLIDLFGSDFPSPDGDGFRFVPGPLLNALTAGDWVLLDELNLAPQPVLEGLNPLLDHRKNIFIPELCRLFTAPDSFMIFGAQNPDSSDRGRKSLPKSFKNRFTSVFVPLMESNDYKEVAKELYPNIDENLVDSIIEFTHQVTSNIKKSYRHENGMFFGEQGAPWEFNLRDILRWCDLIENGAVNSGASHFFYRRFRTIEDSEFVRKLFEQVFGLSIEGPEQLSVLLDQQTLSTPHFKINRKINARKIPSSLPKNLRPVVDAFLASDKPILFIENETAHLIDMFRQFIENSTGMIFEDIFLSPSTDAGELIGAYEETSSLRELNSLVEETLNTVSSIIRALVYQISDSSISGKQVSKFVPVVSSFIDLRRKHKELSQNINRVPQRTLKSAYKVVRRCLNEAKKVQIYSDKEEETFTYSIENLQKSLNKIEKGTSSMFTFYYGPLVKAAALGHWVIIHDVSSASPAVLDRLAPLLERNGTIQIQEKGGSVSSSHFLPLPGITLQNGMEVLKPNKNFRVILISSSNVGDISRPMRNRCVELCLRSEGKLWSPYLFIWNNITNAFIAYAMKKSYKQLLHSLQEPQRILFENKILFRNWVSISGNLVKNKYEMHTAVTIAIVLTFQSVLDFKQLEKFQTIFKKKYNEIVITNIPNCSNQYSQLSFDLKRLPAPTVALHTLGSSFQHVKTNDFSIQNIFSQFGSFLMIPRVFETKILSTYYSIMRSFTQHFSSDTSAAFKSVTPLLRKVHSEKSIHESALLFVLQTYLGETKMTPQLTRVISPQTVIHFVLGKILFDNDNHFKTFNDVVSHKLGFFKEGVVNQGALIMEELVKLLGCLYFFKIGKLDSVCSLLPSFDAELSEIEKANLKDSLRSAETISQTSRDTLAPLFSDISGFKKKYKHFLNLREQTKLDMLGTDYELAGMFCRVMNRYHQQIHFKDKKIHPVSFPRTSIIRDALLCHSSVSSSVPKLINAFFELQSSPVDSRAKERNAVLLKQLKSFEVKFLKVAGQKEQKSVLTLEQCVSLHSKILLDILGSKNKTNLPQNLSFISLLNNSNSKNIVDFFQAQLAAFLLLWDTTLSSFQLSLRSQKSKVLRYHAKPISEFYPIFSRDFGEFVNTLSNAHISNHDSVGPAILLSSPILLLSSVSSTHRSPVKGAWFEKKILDRLKRGTVAIQKHRGSGMPQIVRYSQAYQHLIHILGKEIREENIDFLNDLEKNIFAAEYTGASIAKRLNEVMSINDFSETSRYDFVTHVTEMVSSFANRIPNASLIGLLWIYNSLVLFSLFDFSSFPDPGMHAGALVESLGAILTGANHLKSQMEGFSELEGYPALSQQSIDSALSSLKGEFSHAERTALKRLGGGYFSKIARLSLSLRAILKSRTLAEIITKFITASTPPYNEASSLIENLALIESRFRITEDGDRFALLAFFNDLCLPLRIACMSCSFGISLLSFSSRIYQNTPSLYVIPSHHLLRDSSDSYQNYVETFRSAAEASNNKHLQLMMRLATEAHSSQHTAMLISDVLNVSGFKRSFPFVVSALRQLDNKHFPHTLKQTSPLLEKTISSLCKYFISTKQLQEKKIELSQSLFRSKSSSSTMNGASDLADLEDQCRSIFPSFSQDFSHISSIGIDDTEEVALPPQQNKPLEILDESYQLQLIRGLSETAGVDDITKQRDSLLIKLSIDSSSCYNGLLPQHVETAVFLPYIRSSSTKEIVGKVPNQITDKRPETLITLSFKSFVKFRRKGFSIIDLDDLTAQPETGARQDFKGMNGLSSELISLPDVYRCPYPLELVVFVRDVLPQFSFRLGELSSEFSEDIRLVKLQKIVDLIDSIPFRTTPLMKNLAIVDFLLKTVMDWEEDAPSAYSFGQDIIRGLRNTAIRWRRIELLAWPSLLRSCHNQFDETSAMLFSPFFLDAHQNPDIRFLSQAAVNALTDGPVGGIETRCKIVTETSRSLFTKAFVQRDQKSLMCSAALSLTLASLGPFLSDALRAHDKQSESIISALCSQVKILSWDERNFFTLRQSTDKLHKKVVKVIRNYSELLEGSLASHWLRYTTSLNPSSLQELDPVELKFVSLPQIPLQTNGTESRLEGVMVDGRSVRQIVLRARQLLDNSLTILSSSTTSEGFASIANSTTNALKRIAAKPHKSNEKRAAFHSVIKGLKSVGISASPSSETVCFGDIEHLVRYITEKLINRITTKRFPSFWKILCASLDKVGLGGFLFKQTQNKSALFKKFSETFSAIQILIHAHTTPHATLTRVEFDRAFYAPLHAFSICGKQVRMLVRSFVDSLLLETCIAEVRAHALDGCKYFFTEDQFEAVALVLQNLSDLVKHVSATYERVPELENSLEITAQIRSIQRGVSRANVPPTNLTNSSLRHVQLETVIRKIMRQAEALIAVLRQLNENIPGASSLLLGAAFGILADLNAILKNASKPSISRSEDFNPHQMVQSLMVSIQRTFHAAQRFPSASDGADDEIVSFVPGRLELVHEALSGLRFRYFASQLAALSDAQLSELAPVLPLLELLSSAGTALLSTLRGLAEALCDTTLILAKAATVLLQAGMGAPADEPEAEEDAKGGKTEDAGPGGFSEAKNEGTNVTAEAAQELCEDDMLGTGEQEEEEQGAQGDDAPDSDVVDMEQEFAGAEGEYDPGEEDEGSGSDDGDDDDETSIEGSFADSVPDAENIDERLWDEDDKNDGKDLEDEREVSQGDEMCANDDISELAADNQEESDRPADSERDASQSEHSGDDDQVDDTLLENRIESDIDKDDPELAQEENSELIPDEENSEDPTDMSDAPEGEPQETSDVDGGEELDEEMSAPVQPQEPSDNSNAGDDEEPGADDGVGDWENDNDAEDEGLAPVSAQRELENPPDADNQEEKDEEMQGADAPNLDDAEDELSGGDRGSEADEKDVFVMGNARDDEEPDERPPDIPDEQIIERRDAQDDEHSETHSQSDATGEGSDDEPRDEESDADAKEHAARGESPPPPQADDPELISLRGEEILTSRAPNVDKGQELHALLLSEAMVAATELAERLAAILEPTQASRLEGFYRSGKRLSMRRIIQFIASGYRRDRIWLRRTRPSRRDHQVLIAIDNSRSMLENGAAIPALQGALTLLLACKLVEITNVGLVSFGADVADVLPLGKAQVSNYARILGSFAFDQDSTDFVRLLTRGAAALSAGAARADCSLVSLLLIVSDGRLQDRARVAALCRAALERRQLPVLILLDPLAKDDLSKSISQLTRARFEGGRVIRSSYLDDFPVPFYAIVRDMARLPSILADILTEWFETFAE
eukprot:gnl/Chilomastix_cuspidata/2822.p1 GENE.gnl/Chilomastix_cuspidata/2822~~gnl/Chilomastix_cuspidata/2822.p1  ORF type:complete len:4926 (+),score=474.49 gnl/Chilomastix_cuspidata/2822:1812-14780(+)